MKTFRFSISYKKSIPELLIRARILAHENNALVKGNDDEGEVEWESPAGTIKVKYFIVKDVISLEVVKKPFFLSNRLIKSEISKFLL